MKALTLEETGLKEELKRQYYEKEKDKFKMLCHLEDFEVQYWELQKENERLKDNWNKLKEIVKSQSGFKKRADLKGGLWFEIDELLDKMQELEQGSDSNNEKSL